MTQKAFITYYEVYCHRFRTGSVRVVVSGLPVTTDTDDNSVLQEELGDYDFVNMIRSTFNYWSYN